MLSCSMPLEFRAGEMRRPNVSVHQDLCRCESTFQRRYFRNRTRAVQKPKERQQAGVACISLIGLQRCSKCSLQAWLRPRQLIADLRTANSLQGRWAKEARAVLCPA